MTQTGFDKHGKDPFFHVVQCKGAFLIRNSGGTDQGYGGFLMNMDLSIRNGLPLTGLKIIMIEYISLTTSNFYLSPEIIL
jgi:hypothetical protein